MCFFHFFLLFFPVILSHRVQIKHEPCQVSEITTSNNTQSTRTVHLQAQTQATNLLHQEPLDKTVRVSTVRPVVKSEIKSPTELASIASTTSLSIGTSNMDHNSTNSIQSGQLLSSFFLLTLFFFCFDLFLNLNRHGISSISFTIIINVFLVESARSCRAEHFTFWVSIISHYPCMVFFVYMGIGAIPVGIAVARQRLQEHAQQHQTKDINRFGNIGLTTDLGEFVFYLVFLFNDK